MRNATAERAAAIREHLSRMGADPATARRYAAVAARFEELRLRQHQGQTTPADDRRLGELERMLQIFTRELGLGDDITDADGYLVRDPQRLLNGTWLDCDLRGLITFRGHYGLSLLNRGEHAVTEIQEFPLQNAPVEGISKLAYLNGELA